MFATLQVRILLAVYVFLILSIPIGSYFLSQKTTTFKSRAQQTTDQKKPTPPSKTTTSTATSSAKELQKKLSEVLSEKPVTKPSPTPQATSPTIATSFGPTLSGKITLEGRPKDNQATRLFVGLIEGQVTTKPKFLLSFTVDVPLSGEFGNLSLAGLTSGSSYSALLKGRAQIATSSAFTLAPTETKLSGGNAILQLTGDLNEDNVINSSDYSIVKALLGQTSGSKSWNDNTDFNKDGIINTIDLAIITKNLGKVGASGAWTSPIPTATPSGGLTQSVTESGTLPVGSAMDGSNQGYWLWIPQ